MDFIGARPPQTVTLPGMSSPRFRLKCYEFRGVLDIITVQNHTFSYMVDHFKTLKILNYQLKLSGPQLSHLDRPPTFAVYILILQRSGAWAAPDFASNAAILKVC